MSIYTSQELFEQLKKIIDLPDNIVELTLNIKVNHRPTITILTEENQSTGANGEIVIPIITERFELKNIRR